MEEKGPIFPSSPRYLKPLTSAEQGGWEIGAQKGTVWWDGDP